MSYNFKRGFEYAALLNVGKPEEEIMELYGIDHTELYAVTAFCDQKTASEKLKHFCGGCANDLCFFWPGRDEAPCLARGYEPDCPLKKQPQKD